jgi:DNA-binding transcriptional ArsR family regulator
MPGLDPVGGSRERILQVLRQHPGMNLSRLCRAVGLSWATTKYHLKRLEAEGAVALHRRGRRDIACFPVGVPARYRPWLAALFDPEAAAVLAALGKGEAGVADLSQRTGLSESATRRRLDRLHQNGLLNKRGMLRPRYSRNPEVPEWVTEEEEAMDPWDDEEP